MAYNQAALKNIGDIRDKIVKRKLDKKFGSIEAAEKFKQIEDFRSRAAERNQPKFKTMETSFKTSIKPFEKETIKFDIPEKEKSTKEIWKNPPFHQNLRYLRKNTFWSSILSLKANSF